MDDREARYEPRAIAFIDILGFKVWVKRLAAEPGLADDILRALEYVKTLEEFARFQDRGLEMTAFSDCWVVSHRPERALEVAQAARSVASHFLELELPTRGSLVVADAYHRDRVVFGAGMVLAYETEQSAAMYPRIVVDDAVAVTIRQQEREEETTRSILKRDRDGCWFLDLFGVNRPRFRAYHQRVGKWLSGALQAQLANSPRDLGRIAKLRWLVLQFNESVTGDPSAGIQPLPIDGPAIQAER
jgi:hypothetical protein